MVRAPPEYSQFDLDGTNKLRPCVGGFTSAADALSWAASFATGRGSLHAALQHNSVMIEIDGGWSIYWLPVATGLTLCNLIHPPPSRQLGCHDGMPVAKVCWEGVVIEVRHDYVPHPLERDAAFPCNGCGFPVPSTFRKRCGHCRVAVYCTSECQQRDWPDHKMYCRVTFQSSSSRK